jgi:hypothetical protein
MRWIVRLAVLGAAFLVGRQLWTRALAVQEARRDLDGQRAGIEAAEREIDALDPEIDASEAELGELAARIDAIEREHPDGIPAGLHPAYAALVAEHNQAVARHNDLVSRQRQLHGDYERRVDRHNARVASANSLTTREMTCAALTGWMRPGWCDDPE